MIKINRKPKFSMSAYVECRDCGKHSEIDVNGVLLSCPMCEGSSFDRMEVGASKVPSWFKEGGNSQEKQG